MRFARFALTFGLLLSASGASAAIDTSPLPPKEPGWSFSGPFGTYDRAALQRGFQVYKEVCSACHSLNRVAFAAMSSDNGGDGFFTGPPGKALPAGDQVAAGPEGKGEKGDA